MKTHKDLDVWKLSMELVKEAYLVTGSFPKEEIYGITSQIRRSAVSIPSNIAEGAARNSNKKFTQFLYIALGSCSELETQLMISREIGFVVKEEIFSKINRIGQMITGLIKRQKTRL